jgi:hypothetical protein
MLPGPVATIVSFMERCIEAQSQPEPGVVQSLFVLGGCMRCGDIVFYPDLVMEGPPAETWCRRCGRVSLVEIKPPYRYGWK